MWIELISLVGRKHQGLGGWKAAPEPPGSRFCCSFISSAAYAGHRDPPKIAVHVATSPGRGCVVLLQRSWQVIRCFQR